MGRNAGDSGEEREQKGAKKGVQKGAEMAQKGAKKAHLCHTRPFLPPHAYACDFRKYAPFVESHAFMY